MKKIFTCGHFSKRTQFEYTGSVSEGIELVVSSGRVFLPSRFLNVLLKYFSGKTVPGGFSMADPTSGGVGEWVQKVSPELIGKRLSPRHASFICGVLVHEGYANTYLKGNAVMMEFP